MNSSALKYDKQDKQSILMYARELLGKCVHDLYPDAQYAKAGNKGGLGQRIEEVHFKFSNNSESEPDFKEAGVELKCTPMKLLKDGSMVSKERLVLNIINYLEEYDKTYATSSFTHKNATILLMFYLHLKKVDRFDLLFKIIRLWSIPDEDLKIFMDDWAVIHNKIANGLAHQLSEGDTLYLAACVKGSKGGADKRAQKGTDVLADQRAYSIKSAYINHIIVDSLSYPEMVSEVIISEKKKAQIEDKKSNPNKYKKRSVGRIVKSMSDYRPGETFEELVIRRFSSYFGKTVREIACRLRTSISTSPKAVSYSVCRAILGVKSRRIDEFEKAGLQLKTIRLEYNGNLKEAMSFQTVKYKEIIEEDDWYSSDWYETIGAKRFLFIVFRKRKDGAPQDAVLERVFFWAMPKSDVDSIESFWQDTRDKIRAGDYNHFIKQSESEICHIRPKAKNSRDMMETPQGGWAKKFCYWLNREYVLNIVRREATNAIGKRKK